MSLLNGIGQIGKRTSSSSSDDKSGDLDGKYNSEKSAPLVFEGIEQVGSNPGGAPTEHVSALGGKNLGAFTIMLLNINMMIGTGIFSTGGSLLKALGSPRIVLLFWVLGLAIALAGLAVYLELAHIFPKRAGAEVVYLEQAYNRPKYLFPAAFAFLTVVLSFASSNTITLATYLLYAADNPHPTKWLIRGVAVAGYTAACLLVLGSTKWVLRFNNLLGVLKLIMLVFIVITGWVVLGGGTHISKDDARAAFREPFKGTIRSGNGISNAIIRTHFAFGGYYNALNVVNEIGGKDPLNTLRWTTPLAVLVVGILYICATIAWFTAVPLDTIRHSGTLVAVLFFTSVFGDNAGARVLPALVALSAFGNLIAGLIGSTRMVREIGRQGVLPYPKAWTSTYPFGTPALSILVHWVLTTIMTLAPPAGDAFNFIIDLQSYPSAIFTALSFAGLYIIRHQRKKAGLLPPAYRAWHAAILFSVAINIIILVMPWVPPVGGIYGGDVSFFYATYCIIGIGMMFLCAAYWAVYFKVLPRLRGYTIVEKTITEENGGNYNKLTKVYNDGTPADGV